MAITGDEMNRIDSYSINALEIPGILLMENAALKLLKHIDLVNNHLYTIVCGTGNNGADGLALARHLLNYDHKLEIFIVGDINKDNEEYMTYYRILQNLGQDFKTIQTIEDIENFRLSAKRADLIVDALLGTGLSTPVRPTEEYVIDAINDSESRVLSVDIPSGLDSSTGQILGTCVDADTIVTFQFIKKGLEANRKLFGQIHVESISIPAKAIQAVLGSD